MQKEMKTIREAATALCDRWDTPLWKDAKHTSVFVHELRTALAQPEQEPVADYWVLDDENTSAEEVSFYSFREAKQAASDHGCGLVAYHRTLTRIDAAQPSDSVEQEPVGRVCFSGDEVVWTNDPPESGTLLYTSPPAQRPWVELTDEDVEIINGNTWDVREAARMASAKSKEKNA